MRPPFPRRPTFPVLSLALSLALMSAAPVVLRAGGSPLHFLSDEDVVRRYDHAFAVTVVGVEPNGQTNGSPPAIQFTVEEAFKGERPVGTVRGAWQSPPHDVDWVGEGAQEALAEWRAGPLPAPDVGSRWIVVCERARVGFGILPRCRFPFADDRVAWIRKVIADTPRVEAEIRTAAEAGFKAEIAAHRTATQWEYRFEPGRPWLAHLKGLPDLRVLNLFNRPNSESDLAPLAELQSVTTLIWHNGFTDASLAYAVPLERLETLRFRSGDALTAAGVEHLRRMPALRTVAFQSTVGVDLLRALASVPGVRDLRLHFCQGLTDAGVEALAASQTLERVEVVGCETVTDRSLTALAQMESLRALDVSLCKQLTAKGLESLQAAKNLVRLDTEGGWLADDACLEAIARLSGLETLGISALKSRNEELLVKLGALKKLQRLVIDGRYMKGHKLDQARQAALAQLRAALPGLEVVERVGWEPAP